MLRNKVAPAVGSFLLAGFVLEADATVILDSGGTYLVEHAINDDVIVDDADARVVINSGGLIRGSGDSGGVFSAALRTRRGTAEVRGTGRVIAAPNQDAINMTGSGSAVWLRDQAQVLGNIGNITVPAQLYIQDQAVVNGDIVYGGLLRIEDQALIFGDVMNSNLGNLNLEMRGGVITNTLHMSSVNSHILNMSGGSILGGFRGNYGDVDLDMSGGYIGGGFRTGLNVTGQIRGGRIDGGIAIVNSVHSPYSHLDITGGRFDADAGDWLLNLSFDSQYGEYPGFSTLDIWGGEFGYAEQGLGFFIDDFANFSIWGRDLAYGGGWLTGYLQDGSWFNNRLTFGDNWRGSFTIHNVPEPGTLAMLLMGLVGIRLRGCRKSAFVKEEQPK